MQSHRLFEAKGQVYFAVQEAINDYSDDDVIIEDNKSYKVKEFIRELIFTKRDSQFEEFISFQENSLKEIVDKITDTLLRLKTEKGMLYGRNQRPKDQDKSSILYNKLYAFFHSDNNSIYLEDNRYKIIDVSSYAFQFTKETNKLETDCQGIAKISAKLTKKQSEDYIKAHGEVNEIQSGAKEKIRDICNKIKEKSIGFLAHLPKSLNQEVDKIINKIQAQMNSELAKEINERRLTLLKNANDNENYSLDNGISAIKAAVNELFNPYSSEEIQESAAWYISLLIQRDSFKEYLIISYQANYPTETDKSHKKIDLDFDIIKRASIEEFSGSIEKVNSDVEHLKDAIEFHKLQSLAKQPGSALKQLVSVESNEEGHFARLQKDILKLEVSDYKSKKERFKKLLSDDFLPLNGEQQAQIKELFLQYKNLVRELEEIKNDIFNTSGDIDNYINKFIVEKDGLNIYGKLQEKCNRDAADKKIVELDSIIDSLNNLPEIFFNTRRPDKIIEKFKSSIISDQKSRDELSKFNSDWKKTLSNIVGIKVRIEREHEFKLPLATLDLPEEVPLNNDYPMKQTDNKQFLANTILFTQTKRSCQNQINDYNLLRDKFLNSNFENTDKDIANTVIDNISILKSQYDENKNLLEELIQLINETILKTNEANAARSEIVKAQKQKYQEHKIEHDRFTTLFNNINLLHSEKIDNPLYSHVLKRKKDIGVILSERKNNYLAGIDKILKELSSKNTYLSQEAIDDKINELNRLYTYNLNPSFEVEINTLNDRSERSNMFYVFYKKLHRLKTKKTDVYENVKSHEILFGSESEKEIPEHVVTTKYHHNRCKNAFKQIKDIYSRNSDMIDSKLTEIESKLNTTCMNFDISNAEIKKDIEEDFRHTNDALNQITDEFLTFNNNLQNDLTHFYINNERQILQSTLKPIVAYEESSIKQQYDDVAAYLKSCIDNGHIRVPNGFIYENCRTAKEQHLALKRISKYASTYLAGKKENISAATDKCWNNLITACERQPRPQPYQNLLPKSAPEKVKLSFFEKCKQNIGAVIGGITGAIGGALVGGGLGALVGFFLLPVTFGISVPIGAAIGAVVGGAALGGAIGGGLGAAIGNCIDCCANIVDDEESDAGIPDNQKKPEKGNTASIKVGLQPSQSQNVSNNNFQQRILLQNIASGSSYSSYNSDSEEDKRINYSPVEKPEQQDTINRMPEKQSVDENNKIKSNSLSNSFESETNSSSSGEIQDKSLKNQSRKKSEKSEREKKRPYFIIGFNQKTGEEIREVVSHKMKV